MTSLAGPRLLLRDFRAADVQAVHSFAADPVVTRLTDFGPNTPEQSAEFVRAAVAQARRAHRTAFSLAAELVETGLVIGSVGIAITSVEHRRGDLGYVLHSSYWSRGYATEAATLLLGFGREVLGLHRIEATCHPDNHASARVLEKIGMRREGRLRGHLLVRGTWRDSLLYAAVGDGAG
ncbi:GNAT family N-acetyltransferase [Pseudonocardia humida]|uniref:GNAT family N-acetyltransferase n=1 Tax=Pseudonocardia humida TaxID=2800819 RepID=A0ABT1A8J6_9PSEU|nr:GNAT family protein [Pseudonocardia humida]MCO1659355.1 GNAT family N-acetyltransferase [Pseudonocardia humida]